MNKLPTEFVNSLLLSDCFQAMRLLPNNCIQLTVTSPPYDSVRAYGEHQFDFYGIAEELYRVTAPGGVVVWIVQEQVVRGSQSGSSSEQRSYFYDIGFNLYDLMVMVSVGHRLPQKGRYVNQYQQAIVLSKGQPRSVTILEDRPNRTVGKISKGKMRTRNGDLVMAHRDTITSPLGKRSNVWEYSVGGVHTTRDHYAFGHPALMAERMAQDHILSWSCPNDIVFDPMCGAATTCKMALLNDRRYLGVEIYEPYFDIAVQRMRDAQKMYQRQLDEAIEANLLRVDRQMT
jgi:DNA modification methylase